MEVSRKVLVAEADEVVLVLITHILTRQSYTVHRAATAAETEQLIARGDYDAMIVAPCMPDDCSGFLCRILETNPALKCRLIVLANSASEAASFEKAGVQAVMRKPIEVYDLMQTVHDCVVRN